MFGGREIGHVWAIYEFADTTRQNGHVWGIERIWRHGHVWCCEVNKVNCTCQLVVIA